MLKFYVMRPNMVRLYVVRDLATFLPSRTILGMGNIFAEFLHLGIFWINNQTRRIGYHEYAELKIL